MLSIWNSKSLPPQDVDVRSHSIGKVADSAEGSSLRSIRPSPPAQALSAKEQLVSSVGLCRL
jgi:hypothetical protein